MRIFALMGLLLLAACGARDGGAQKEENPVSNGGGIVQLKPPQIDPGELLARQASDRLVGTRAPNVSLKTIDGQTVRLADLFGKKAIYIKFWATWCVPCREQMPHFEEVTKNAGADLAVLAVNTGFNDNADLVKEYQRKLGLTMPIAIDEDGKLARAFDLRVTPQNIIIGKDGRIDFVSHLADTNFDRALAAARRGDPPPTRQGISADAKGKGVEGAAGVVNAQLIKLRPAAGQRRYLLFFSTWCESYWKESRAGASRACRTARMISSSRERDPRWIGIAARLWTSPSDLSDYARDSHAGIPLLLDSSGEMFRFFDVHAVPEVIVIDSDGKVVERIDGPGSSFALRLWELEEAH